MRTRVFAKWCLPAVVLTLGLAGCGGGGLEEGLPPPDAKGIPLDPNMVNMKGASFADQKKAAAKNAELAKEAPPPAPEEKKE